MAPSNTIEQAPKSPYYAATDPHQLATRFLIQRGQDSHQHLALRYWRDEFWRFHEGRYRRITCSELQANVSEFIRDEFQRAKPTNKQGQLLQVTRNVVGNVMQALTAEALVESHLEQPIWIGRGGSGPYFVFANGLVNVHSLVGDQQPHGISLTLRSHCSNWFSQTAFPYDFNAAASCPRWLTFLNEVLEKDQERVDLPAAVVWLLPDGGHDTATLRGRRW